MRGGRFDLRHRSLDRLDPLDTHLSCVAATVPPGTILNIYPSGANNTAGNKDDHHHVKKLTFCASSPVVEDTSPAVISGPVYVFSALEVVFIYAQAHAGLLSICRETVFSP